MTPTDKEGEKRMLEGIRVLDFSQYLPGPHTSMRLADKGAEVIKVEPLQGDPSRALGARRKENGLIYLANNRNKKSITVNLKEEAGQALIKQLIEKSDVIIESFRPGVMERLGLSYEQAKKIKPDIIYCSMTGYGQNTSMSGFGSHDINYVAMSGVLSQLKDKDGRPVHPTITLADLVGGISASEEIVSAIVQKHLKGVGAYIDLSLTDVMVSMMNNHVLISEITGYNHGVDMLTGKLISYHLYETKEGRFMSLGALEPKFWVNFCHAVGKEEWISAHYSEANESNPIYCQVRELFLSHTLDEWMSFAKKVDCCLAPVLEVDELRTSTYVKERKLIHESDNGYSEVATSYGKERYVKAPELSKHTEGILENILGLTKEEIDDLKERNII